MLFINYGHYKIALFDNDILVNGESINNAVDF